jgi:hypothetical protein
MTDNVNIRYVLQAEHMGHEIPGMCGVYKHIASERRIDLMNGPQRLWGSPWMTGSRSSAFSSRRLARKPSLRESGSLISSHIPANRG